MRISYHEDTDSLYIYLSYAATDESEEVADSTVLHFDKDGNVTGIEIYSNASDKVDGLPCSKEGPDPLDVDTEKFDVIEAGRKGVRDTEFLIMPKR